MSKYNFELKTSRIKYYLNSKCGYKPTKNH